MDVAIVTEPERLDPSIVFEQIFEEELKVVVHKELAHGSISDLLRAYPFVRFNPAMGVGRVIDATLRERRMLVNDVMEFDSIETMISIAKLKLGVTVIPIGLVSSNLTADLKTISFTPPVYRRIGILVRRGLIDAPTVRAVADAFKSFASLQALKHNKRRKSRAGKT